MFCITQLLLLPWLYNCTDVDEAPDQDGGEIDRAPTWNTPSHPPEAGDTVAGRPKASKLIWKPNVDVRSPFGVDVTFQISIKA